MRGVARPKKACDYGEDFEGRDSQRCEGVRESASSYSYVVAAGGGGSRSGGGGGTCGGVVCAYYYICEAPVTLWGGGAVPADEFVRQIKAKPSTTSSQSSEFASVVSAESVSELLYK